MSLVLHDPEICLVTRLVDALAADPARATRQVVLPTRRLGTLVAARLAERLGGAVLLPRMSNFRSFISEAILPHFSFTASVMSPFAKQEILRGLLQQSEFRVLGEAHLHELQQLLRELHNFAIPLAKLSERRDQLAGDVFKDAREDYQLEKISETIDLFQQFADFCYQHKLATQEEFAAAQNACFLQQQQSFANTFVVGLTTLTPAELACLAKIAAEGTVWLHDFRSETSAPLATIAEYLGTHTSVSAVPANGAANYVRALQVRSEEEQWATVTQAVKELLASGVPAAAIAILAADEKRAHQARRDLLRDAELAINCPVSLPLAQTKIGSYALLLCDLFERQDTLALYALYEHPLCPYSVAQEAWNRYLCDQITNVGISDIPAAHVVNEIRASLASRDSYLQRLCELLAFLLAAPSAAEAERQAKIALQQLFSEWQALPLPREPGITQIRAAIQELEVRERGEPLAGVQILSIDEARTYPFEHVFLLDMIDGVFPKRSPRDVILNELLKRDIGLPGWRTLEAMETVTFKSLLQRIPQLYLFFYEQEKTGQKRSKFIDLATAHSRQAPLTLIQPVDEVTDQDWEAQVARDGIGRFPDLAAAWPHSATSMDRFIKCPYAQLLHSQGIDRLELPAATVDLRAEGEWLHAIVEGFFREGEFHGLQLSPWPKDLTSSCFPDFALARLNDLTENLRLGFSPDASLLAQLRQYSWPRLVEHFTRVLALNSYRQPGPESREYEFTTSLFDLAFGGKVDAIDDLGEAWLITDYKRKATPAGKMVKQGLNAQLPIYMQALQHSADFAPRPLLSGYWSLLKGEWTVGTLTEDVRQIAIALGLATRYTPTMTEAMASLETLFTMRKDDIAAHQAFAADPSDCGYCQFSGICRHADPQYASKYEEASRLKEFLSE